MAGRAGEVKKKKQSLTHYQKNKKYYKRYNKLYYLKKIMADPNYNKKLNEKRKKKKQKP